MNAVTVIGLGAMGSALSQLFLNRGRDVTLWNRTADKAQPLVTQGARWADSAADAMARSPLVVMCVYDYRAVDEILAQPGVA